MPNFCLGLSGQKRNGKDTVCDIIKPLLDKELDEFKRISFADGFTSSPKEVKVLLTLQFQFHSVPGYKCEHCQFGR